MSYQDVKNSRDRRKKEMLYVMGETCQVCGYDRCQTALEFHHIDPKKKEFFFDKASSTAWSKIVLELKKCILICANCHREVHAGLIKSSFQTSFIEERAKEISSKIEKMKNKELFYCPTCQVEITRDAKQCRNCLSLTRRVVIRPDRDTLKKDIREVPFTHLAKKYGVSDNAIRKWCKTEKLPHRKIDIIKYSDEDWKDI